MARVVPDNIEVSFCRSKDYLQKWHDECNPLCGERVRVRVRVRVSVRVGMLVRMSVRVRVRYTPGITVCGNTVLATRAPLAIPGSNPSIIGAVAAKVLKAEQWGTCQRYDRPTVLAMTTHSVS